MRIPTQGRKIRILKENLASSTSPKYAESLKNSIQIAQEEDEEYKKLLIDACKEYYTFTPYVFVVDSLFQRFLNGDNTVFLNSEGKSITIDDFNRDNYFTEKGQNITMSKKLASYQIYKPQ